MAFEKHQGEYDDQAEIALAMGRPTTRNSVSHDTKGADVAPKDTIRSAIANGRLALSEPESKMLLRGMGIAVPTGVLLDDEQFPAERLASLKPPYAVKIVSPDALHKSDGGGVKLGMMTVAEVREAVSAIKNCYQGCRVTGFLVEEMASGGMELIVGANNDPTFGPSILVGAGGVQAELWQDVSVRLCPVNRRDAHQMLAELKSAPLLDGYRGGVVIDRDAIVDIMMAIGGEQGLMARYDGEIASLDLNPVIAGAQAAVAVDARILLTSSAPGDAPHGQNNASCPQVLRSLFQPQSIAVVGASSDGRGPGNSFIRNLRSFGFAGNIHVVHPKATEIDGIAAVTSLAALPQKVDYAYIAVAAASVPELLANAEGKVSVAQVMSSGFAETEGGASLQEELVRCARQGGVRVLGPNCLGTHAGRARMTFIDSLQDSFGRFSVISQSGGMGVDILRRGQGRGLRFANLVTLGNEADISVGEILAYLLNDEDTQFIGMYLESVSDGRAVSDLLRQNQSKKPVVILKGGASSQGQRAAQSHTGALASDHRIWEGLARQTGTLLVDTLDGFLDTALALQSLPERTVRGVGNVVLFGNGGGTSVVACDTFARMGLDVIPFDENTRNRLEALNLPPGASVVNPIDTPAGVLNKGDGSHAEQILRIVHDTPGVDAFVLHLNLPVIVGYYDEALMKNLIDAAVRVRLESQRQVHFLMVLRSDGSQRIDDMRRIFRYQALEAGIPVYDEMPDVAYVLARVNELERFRYESTHS